VKFGNRLKRTTACSRAIKWVGNKGVRRSWDECPYGTWMDWFVFHLRVRGHLNRNDIDIVAKALRQFDTDLSPADRIRIVMPVSKIIAAMKEYEIIAAMKECTADRS